VFDFEELEYHYLVANRTEDVPSKGEYYLLDNQIPRLLLLSPFSEDGEEGDSENEEMDGDKSKEEKPELEIKPNSTTNKAILENPNIDNPYLRAATLPKRSKTGPTPGIMPTRGLAGTAPSIPTPSTLEITKNVI